MNKDQRSRWLGIVGIFVVIAVILKVVFRVLRIFSTKRPPIVSSGGSINVCTHNDNVWKPSAGGFITSKAVDTSVIKTSGLSPNLSANLSKDWSVTICTQPYPNQSEASHNGSLIIKPGDNGTVQITSPEGFSDVASDPTHGKCFHDPTSAMGPCKFQAMAVKIDGIAGTPSSLTLKPTRSKWEVGIGKPEDEIVPSPCEGKR